jgi:hypothetical protein
MIITLIICRASCQCWLKLALAVLLVHCGIHASARGIVYGTFPATTPLHPDWPTYPYDKLGYQLISILPEQPKSFGFHADVRSITSESPYVGSLRE